VLNHNVVQFSVTHKGRSFVLFVVKASQAALKIKLINKFT